jgi:hypothetical protein
MAGALELVEQRDADSGSSRRPTDVNLPSRWLFATPYHSSNATIDDSKATLSRATTRRNRRRKLASVPLMRAMHVFVSSRYVVMEDVALGGRWLPTPFGHERFGGQAIQFREPLFYVREYRLDEDSSPVCIPQRARLIDPSRPPPAGRSRRSAAR